MAVMCGAGSESDLHKTGTQRERAYLRSIPISKLGEADQKEFDRSDDDDEEEMEEEKKKYL